MNRLKVFLLLSSPALLVFVPKGVINKVCNTPSSSYSLLPSTIADLGSFVCESQLQHSPDVAARAAWIRYFSIVVLIYFLELGYCISQIVTPYGMAFCIRFCGIIAANNAGEGQIRYVSEEMVYRTSKYSMPRPFKLQFPFNVISCCISDIVATIVTVLGYWAYSKFGINVYPTSSDNEFIQLLDFLLRPHSKSWVSFLFLAIFERDTFHHLSVHLATHSSEALYFGLIPLPFVILLILDGFHVLRLRRMFGIHALFSHFLGAWESGFAASLAFVSCIFFICYPIMFSRVVLFLGFFMSTFIIGIAIISLIWILKLTILLSVRVASIFLTEPRSRPPLPTVLDTNPCSLNVPQVCHPKVSIPHTMSSPDEGQTSSPESPLRSQFDYFNFAKFLAYRNITIIPFNELQPLNILEIGNGHGNVSSPFSYVGQGASMSVQLRTLNGELVAIKGPRGFHLQTRSLEDDEWSSSPAYKEQVIFEVQVMSHKPLCDHPNIVRLIGLSFIDLIPIPIVEAAIPQYPDLQTYIQSPNRPKPLPLKSLYHLVSDLADGISAIHDFGVIHGDMKPKNVLLFKDGDGIRAKVADFGSIGIDIAEQHPSAYAESEWLPPDFSLYCEESRQPSLDIYGFGRVGLFLCTEGSLPKDSRPVSADILWHNIHELRTDDLSVLVAILNETLVVDRFRRTKDIGKTRSSLFGP